MSEEANNEAIIAVFVGEETAQKALQDVIALGTAETETLQANSTVITFDDGGKVSVSGTPKKGKSAIVGGVVGMLVGGLLGGPVIGAAIGGALGVSGAGKKAKGQIEDLASKNDELEAFLTQIPPNSSVILTSVADYSADTVIDAFESRGATAVWRSPEADLA